MVNGFGGASSLTPGTMGTKRRVPGSIPKQWAYKLKWVYNFSTDRRIRLDYCT